MNVHLQLSDTGCSPTNDDRFDKATGDPLAFYSAIQEAPLRISHQMAAFTFTKNRGILGDFG